jgi:glucosamine-phosphate N-acetyltransferase
MEVFRKLQTPPVIVRKLPIPGELQNLIFREIKFTDFTNYMNLMFEFTNYKHSITKEQFIDEINSMKYNCKIIVIEYDNNIIGAGSIFKINKLHNNPIGQIEDVIITSQYRKYGLGKLLINKLIKIGYEEFNCYKVILNCLEKNIEFYKKNGFDVVGVEMKYIA